MHRKLSHRAKPCRKAQWSAVKNAYLTWEVAVKVRVVRWEWLEWIGSLAGGAATHLNRHSPTAKPQSLGVHT